MIGLDLIVGGAAGVMTGLCLGESFLYLVRLGTRESIGGFPRNVAPRIVGGLALLLGALDFIAWLLIPWFASQLAPGEVPPTSNWLGYLITIPVGIIAIEVAYRGGQGGRLTQKSLGAEIEQERLRLGLIREAYG